MPSTQKAGMKGGSMGNRGIIDAWRFGAVGMMEWLYLKLGKYVISSVFLWYMVVEAAQLSLTQLTLHHISLLQISRAPPQGPWLQAQASCGRLSPTTSLLLWQVDRQWLRFWGPVPTFCFWTSPSLEWEITSIGEVWLSEPLHSRCTPPSSSDYLFIIIKYHDFTKTSWNHRMNDKNDRQARY